MKIRTLFCITLIGFCLSVNHFCYTQRKLIFGFQAGLSDEKLTLNDPGRVIDPEQIPGGSIGLLLNMPLTKNISLDTGIGFAFMNIDLNFSLIPGLQGGEPGGIYWQIPIQFKYDIFTLFARKQKLILSPIFNFSYAYNPDASESSFGINQTIPSPGNPFEYYFEFYNKKKHFLIFGLGFQTRFVYSKKIDLFANVLFTNAFQELQLAKGWVEYQGQRYETSLSNQGKSLTLQLGLYRRFRWLTQEQRKEKREEKSSQTKVPPQYVHLSNLFHRHTLSFVLGSPLFLAKTTQTWGEGRLNLFPGPGLSFGFDHYWNDESHPWSWHLGARISYQHYLYRYRVGAAALAQEQDFKGMNSIWYITLNMPAGVIWRYPLSRRSILFAGGGVNVQFVPSGDSLRFKQPVLNDFKKNSIINIDTEYANGKFSAFLSAAPTLRAGYGRMLRNGCMLMADLSYQQGFRKILQGEYSIYTPDGRSQLGGGKILARDSGFTFQLSYVFNSLKRQLRQGMHLVE